MYHSFSPLLFYRRPRASEIVIRETSCLLLFSFLEIQYRIEFPNAVVLYRGAAPRHIRVPYDSVSGAASF
jgi:hypothetical protein